MTRAKQALSSTLLALALGPLALGCGGDEIVVGAPPQAPSSATPSAASPPPGSPSPAGDAAASAEDGGAEAAAQVAAPPSYRDDDFTEAETNRDPFRNYAALFVPRTNQPQGRIQRHVIMDTTSIDQMRLIAIISGVANPSAMLLDAGGTGYTVRRGDYLGRVEYVSSGGVDAVPIPLIWRVDRISPNEVVLSREDPASPTQVALSRVLVLHEAETSTN